jgi:hypothetical protein
MGKERKGQLSFTLKPFTMVMIIVMLLFLTVYLNSSETKKEAVKRDLEVRSAATDTILILANSEDCLAYQLPTGVSAYANIIDVSKLEKFSKNYQGIEPDCARNYGYGFRVDVSEIVMGAKGPREGKVWSFGMVNFSESSANGYFDNKISYWMPVALKYSEKQVGVGEMKVTIIDGELERVAGFIDRACMMGKTRSSNQSSAKIQISYPLSYIDNQLCIGMKNKDCRRTLCKLEMEDLKAAGNYRLTATFELPDKLTIKT